MIRSCRSQGILALAFGLAGCSAFPDPMAGRFDSAQDYIVVKKDGSVYWSPEVKAGDPMRFVGIGTADRKTRGRVWLTVASVGPCYGVTLMYSADLSRVAIDWGTCHGDRATLRSTEFARVTPR